MAMAWEKNSNKDAHETEALVRHNNHNDDTEKANKGSCGDRKILIQPFH